MTEVTQNEITIAGRNLNWLVADRGFGDTIYLLFTGEMAEKGQGKVIEKILTALCDFGPMPTSTTATRLAASCGAGLVQSVIAGIACYGVYHAPVERAASMLKAMSVEEAVALKRIPGLGHPFFTNDDPRIESLKEHGSNYWLKLRSIRELYATQTKKRLPINMAGVAAALLLDIGIKPEYATAFFVIGRLPGLVYHAVEQSKDPEKCKVLWRQQH